MRSKSRKTDYCVSNHLVNLIIALLIARSNLQDEHNEAVSDVFPVQVRVFHAIY